MSQTQIVWERKYQWLLRRFLVQHTRFNGSQVCEYMRSRGLPEPDHHNFWGAQISYYASAGWFKKVGHVKPTSRPRPASPTSLRSQSGR